MAPPVGERPDDGGLDLDPDLGLDLGPVDDAAGGPGGAPGPDDPVRAIMSRPVLSVPGRASLRQVAIELARAGIGAVLVADADQPVGIMTERDVVRALAEGADPDAVWAADVMTPRALFAAPDDVISSVAELMRIAEVRHVPVRDGERIVGIVSLRDILDAFML